MAYASDDPRSLEPCSGPGGACEEPVDAAKATKIRRLLHGAPYDGVFPNARMGKLQSSAADGAPNGINAPEEENVPKCPDGASTSITLCRGGYSVEFDRTEQADRTTGLQHLVLFERHVVAHVVIEQVLALEPDRQFRRTLVGMVQLDLG